MNKKIYYRILMISLIFFCQAFRIQAQYVAYYSAMVKNTSGQAVENVTVVSTNGDTAQTNAEGKFIIGLTSLFSDSVESHDSRAELLFLHPDYLTTSLTVFINEGDSIIGPDVILSNIVTVSGKVKLENNEPVMYAFVNFYNSTNYFYAATDIEGNYSTQVAQGSYYIFTTAAYRHGDAWTYRLLYYNNKTKLEEADLIEINSNTANLDFTFPVLQVGTISGKVMDAQTQQPLSNVFISVASAEPRDSNFIGTDENGNYSIEVFEGIYHVYAYEYGYYLQFYDNVYNSFDATPVILNGDNLNITGIDFNLTKPEPGSNIISGFVRDKTTNLEIVGLQVYAVPVSGGNWIESTTGNDGRYIIRDIANGDYVLLFYKENYISQFYKNEYETCSEWEDALIFSLHGNEYISNLFTWIEPMNPFGGEISGIISSGSDFHINGTLVSAVDSSGKVISSSISAYNGNYVIPFLKNGSYTLKASRIGYHSSEYSDKIQIDLDSNPIIDGINILMITTGIEKDGNTNPDFFKLSQNYPNPFNPSTRIKYSIPASLNPAEGGTLVKLEVYDLLGRKVATLVNEEKPAGEYEVEFSASYLSSGVYFYSLRAGSFIQTNKMILAK